MAHSLSRLLLPLLVVAGAVPVGAVPLQVQPHDPLDRSCPRCDLRDADLSGAQLQRANLGQARLDGADLRGADLSFTSLRGASLRGANLEGARLYGTDLRESDLSAVRLDQGALEEAHWQGAQGIASGVQSHASLHNAGVEAAQAIARQLRLRNLGGIIIVDFIIFVIAISCNSRYLLYRYHHSYHINLNYCH